LVTLALETPLSPSGGQNGEDDLLASCYRRSLEVASRHAVKSIAFPSISTGVYGFPIELAAPIAVATLRDAAPQWPVFDEIISCCFSSSDRVVYQKILDDGTS
jgi:O-acetyl-ADP-ribose deacetylase (regulator of RNase III)